jgi:hypothetical protein
MIVSYDIDGVLAEGPPPSEKKWGRMNKYERLDRKRFLVEWYRIAKPLLVPEDHFFFAVSARKNEGEVYAATKKWLDFYYPGRVVDIYLLEGSRSVANAAAFKADVIKRNGVQIHYEDNKKVLKLMKLMVPEVKYFFWEKGMVTPVEY